jgi:hypothetical protein
MTKRRRRQYNGQRKKDIQHNDQKKDRQYNGSKLTMLCPLSGDTRIQGKEDRGTDIDSLQKNISI